MNKNNVSQNKLRLLTETDHKIFGLLICHQLAKNGYIEKFTNIKQRSQIIKSYDKCMDNAGIFIKQLLNNITKNTIRVKINMDTMYNDVLEECSNSLVDGCGG